MTENVLDNEGVAAIRAAALGHKIVGAEGSSTLVLDNGARLTLFESEQYCCAYAEGSWILDRDNLDAIITDVKASAVREGDEYDTAMIGTVAILHNQNTVALAELYANNGNADYYMSVLSVRVALGDPEAATETVLLPSRED